MGRKGCWKDPVGSRSGILEIRVACFIPECGSPGTSGLQLGGIRTATSSLDLSALIVYCLLPPNTSNGHALWD